MSVSKYKISQKDLTGSTIQLPIVIDQKNSVVGQTDRINSTFVKDEKENAINEIIDYEKVRFSPIDINNNILNEIKYRLYFYENQTDTYPNNLTWGDIGFSEEDVLFRKDKFTKSFLRLTFYDSDDLFNQNPIFFMTLFPKYNISSSPTTNSIIEYTRHNSVTNPKGFAEGFYLYFYKDLVDINTEFNLYARASFFNANKDSEMSPETPMMIVLDKPEGIHVTSGIKYSDKIHLKFTFKKTNANYLYYVDDADNVTYNNDDVLIKFYESQTVAP